MEKSILRLEIRSEADVATAHRKASQISELAGLESGSGYDFANAVSEVCRNVLKHVGEADAEFLVDQVSDTSFIEAVISNRAPKLLHSSNGHGSSNGRKHPAKKHNSKVWLRAQIPSETLETDRDYVKKWRKKLGKTASDEDAGKHKSHQKIVQQLDYLRWVNSAVTKNILENESYITDAEKAHQKILHLLKKSEQGYAELKLINQHLDAYAYSVSHDLKSPLRNLEGLLTALRDEITPECGTEALHMMELMSEQVQRMDKFIASMLASARSRTPGKVRKLVNPVNLINKVLKNLNIAGGFKVKVQPRMHDVYTSPVKLGQVLGNLILNAYKHHDCNEGQIVVKALYNKRKEMITFKVSDDGPGIPAEKQGEIFRTFKVNGHTPTEQSSGLGLYMIKQIVEEAGGKIWVESEGRGCCFSFTWPVGLPDEYFKQQPEVKETEKIEQG